MNSTLESSDFLKSRASTYELLLHSLSNQHGTDNYERHVLVLEKWCRESSGGIYISDLNNVVEVLKILRSRISTNPDMFMPVLGMVLNNLAQPLLESKSNERLRKNGIESIKSLYTELTKLWEENSLQMRIECARCFLIIVNGGRNPSVLKANQVEWKSDGLSAQVNDISFIQSLLRESGALDAIVKEFDRTINEFIFEKQYFMKSTFNLSKLNKTQEGIDRSGFDDDSDDEDRNLLNQKDDTLPSHPGNQESDVELQKRKVTLGSLQELIQILLDLCLQLSNEPQNAAKMCVLFICESTTCLLGELAADSIREPKISICIEIIWNCLEYYLIQFNLQNSATSGLIKYDNIMDFKSSLNILKDVFIKFIFEGYRSADKEIRNEIVIVFTLIANFPSAIPCFLESGLFLDIITYSCVGEAGKDSWTFFSLPIAKYRNFYSAFDADIQLKRELWMLISDIMAFDNQEITSYIASCPLISVMLKYLEKNGDNKNLMSITGNGNSNGSEDFSLTPSETSDVKDDLSSSQAVSTPTQIRELQTLAIAFLAENAHKVLKEFVEIDGPIRILDVIIKFGRSVNTDNKMLVFHSLSLINRCLLNLEDIKDMLQNHNAIEIALIQFEESEDEPTRTQAARLISIMCNGSSSSKEQLRKLNGITSLIQSLAKYSEPRRPTMVPTSGSQSLTSTGSLAGGTEEKDTNEDLNFLIVSVLDCIWNSVVGYKKNETRFAEDEGVDALLDLIEVAPLLIRVQALRVFGDLLNNKRNKAYATAWRSGKTMRSVGQLLAHIWMEEEKRLNYERDNGVVCNLWDPLGSHRWPNDHLTPTSDNNSHQSTTVGKLSTAISTSRKDLNDNEQQNECESISLNIDMRVIIANVLASLGTLSDFSEGFLNSQANQRTIDDFEDEYEYDEESSLAYSKSPAVDVLTNNIGKEPIKSKDNTLSAEDLQVISMAARYGTLREGQWWQTLRDELLDENMLPIEADACMLCEKIEKCFDTARLVQFEQMELSSESNRLKKAEEEVFIGNILKQKNQEIKSEWLKRKSQKNKTQHSHHLTKVKL